VFFFFLGSSTLFESIRLKGKNLVNAGTSPSAIDDQATSTKKGSAKVIHVLLQSR